MHHQEKLSSPDTVTSTVTVGLRESVSPTDSEGTNPVTGGVDFVFFFFWFLATVTVMCHAVRAELLEDDTVPCRREGRNVTAWRQEEGASRQTRVYIHPTTNRSPH